MFDWIMTKMGKFSVRPVRAIRSFYGYTNHAVEWDYLTGNRSRSRLVKDMLEALYWMGWR